MNTLCDYYGYMERLENKRFLVQGSLIELGKLGVLIHPVKIIKLKLEEKRLDQLEKDISKMTEELNSSKPGYNSSILQDALDFYMIRNPIDENGISFPKRVKKYNKNRNL